MRRNLDKPVVQPDRHELQAFLEYIILDNSLGSLQFHNMDYPASLF